MRRVNRSLLVVALAAALPALAGCTGYGEVSPTAYQYAKALYSISNRQLTEKLEPVEKQIEAARQAGELPAHEAEWLLEIVDQCRAGEWEEASRHARRMMEDQLHRS